MRDYTHGNTRITLKNVKIAQFASQETHCFQATLYFDGKRMFTVNNEGSGGPDNQHPLKNQSWEDFRKNLKVVDEYCKTLPKWKLGMEGVRDLDEKGKEKEYDTTLDIVVGDLTNLYLYEKDLKKSFRSGKNIVYTDKHGHIREARLRRGKYTKEIGERYRKQINDQKGSDGVDIILNDMPFAEALKLFIEATQPQVA